MKILLEEIIKNTNRHARWLNSLSYLEYRGFRKIARSQLTVDIDENILCHAMEEVRHALFFKKMALKIGGRNFSNYKSETLLSEDAVKSYFYELDWGTASLCHQHGVTDKKSLYHCVTWLIEERAMQVYKEYENILKIGNFDFSLRIVIDDETKHLDGVRKLAQAVFSNDLLKVERLVQLELDCFSRLRNSIFSFLKIELVIEKHL